MALSNLKKECDFLRLLLKTSLLQVKALFYSLMPRQTLVLCEILCNLTKLPLPPKVRTLIRKRKRVVKRLIAPTLSFKKKVELLRKYYRHLHPLFSSVTKKLLRLTE